MRQQETASGSRAVPSGHGTVARAARDGRRCMCSAPCAQEENEGEEDLLDQASSLLSAVLKLLGDGAMPLVDGLMPQLAALLEPQASPEERRVAICALDDVLEFSPAGAHSTPKPQAHRPEAALLCLRCATVPRASRWFSLPACAPSTASAHPGGVRAELHTGLCRRALRRLHGFPFHGWPTRPACAAVLCWGVTVLRRRPLPSSKPSDPGVT